MKYVIEEMCSVDNRKERSVKAIKIGLVWLRIPSTFLSMMRETLPLALGCSGEFQVEMPSLFIA